MEEIKLQNENNILQELINEGLIGIDKVKELKENLKDDIKVVEMIESKGLVSEEDMAKIKGKVMGIPYIDIFGKNVSPSILNLIPRELSENYQVIAFNKQFNENDKINELSVAMVDPSNFKASEAIEFIARENKYKIKYYIISMSGYRYADKQYATLGSEVEEALASTESKERGNLDEMLKQEKGMEEVVKSAPVAKMVNVILKHAVEGNASDIHIEPVENETRVRYRVDGILHTSLILPRYVHSSIVARIKVLSNLKLDETRVPQDGRFRTEWEGRVIDYRVSTLPLFSNEKVVMRILDRASVVLNLEKLGFEGAGLEIMKKAVEKTVGMILLTGPTGSGKSTTLSAMLSIINDDHINIITLEDPVEYYINGINQSQINPDVGLTFAAGLRSILRQDPDVIMVGEIRDNETAELAVHASLTGHLVLSTLHTNDAFGAIPRLIDMDIEPFLITASLNTVVAQRLVRRLCPYCQKEYKLPQTLREEIEKNLAMIPDESFISRLGKKPTAFKFYEAEGCTRCENTGYKGRILINEILTIDEALKKVIVNNPTIDMIKETAQRQKMISMLQDGLLKALEKKTSLQEIIRATKE
ncbi:MAG: GspE/PulE family protein [bacterium]|nr:GspE/PulE family protein [bacterium]